METFALYYNTISPEKFLRGYPKICYIRALFSLSALQKTR